MVAPSIPFYVNQPIFGDIGDEPRDLVRVSLYHDSKGRLWINDSVNGAIRVNSHLIYERLDVRAPQLLPLSLKACWRGIVDVPLKKRARCRGYDRLFVRFSDGTLACLFWWHISLTAGLLLPPLSVDGATDPPENAESTDSSCRMSDRCNGSAGQIHLDFREDPHFGSAHAGHRAGADG